MSLIPVAPFTVRNFPGNDVDLAVEELSKRGVRFGRRLRRTSLRPRLRLGKRKGDHAREWSDDRLIQRSGRKYSSALETPM